MAGGGSKGSTQQVSEVKLPEWVNQASQSNYKRAQGIADTPYAANPYGGAAAVAPWTDLQNQAAGMLPQVGQYQGAYGSAQNALQGLLSYNPAQIEARNVNAGQIRNTDLTPYMNPYTNEVEANTVRQMQQDAALGQNKLSADAAAAKSFGGSRQGVQQGVAQAETTKKIGDTVSQLRSANFAQAQAAATADIDRALKGDMTNVANWTDVQKANVTNALTAKGLQRQAADDLVAAATAGQSSALTTLNSYMQTGAMQQAQQQKVIDEQSAAWQEQRDYPLKQLNILLASLGMSPYGKTEITNKKEEKSQSPDMIGGITGTLGALAPLLAFASDRSMKTDVQPMGKDIDTDLPMYAYRYKGDPKSYPKVVGPMAQDVERKYPKAVRVIGGKKVIDLTHLAA